MYYSLAQAAKAVGKSKQTVARAIKAGKLSAGRGEDASYVIDPAELARVFPIPGAGGAGTGPMEQCEPGNGPDPHRGADEGLRLLLAEREATIRDLRARLDAAGEDLRREAEERREVQRKLTALLTHRQSGTVPAVQPAVDRVPWWRRWFR